MSTHWLPRALPLKRSGFVYDRRYVDDNEYNEWSNLAHKSLVTFLSHRANEMRPGGYLYINLPGIMDGLWWCQAMWEFLNDYFNQEQIEMCPPPVYIRTKEDR
eukprot:UN15748